MRDVPELNSLVGKMMRSAQDKNSTIRDWAKIIKANIARRSKTADAADYEALRKVTLDNIDKCAKLLKSA